MKAIFESQLNELIEYAAPKPEPFDGKVPVTQKVLDADDYRAMISAVLEGNLTHGKHAAEFERLLAAEFGVRHAAFCNSGSSANLLALASLMDEHAAGIVRLRPGDEVVVCAAGFPTTLNPVIQLGLVPVFVDCEIGTYNAVASQVAKALQRPKCRAVMLAHTLGNPFYSEELLCKTGPLLVEDCCDSLGSLWRGKHVGSEGDVATCSFYPAHHITTMEGGAVMTDNAKIAKAVESFRDWGRDCWCTPGKDNTCGKRFCWEWSRPEGHMYGTGLPDGYDHKHVFSRIGWNLKATDIQAAFGVSQMKKLHRFCEIRRRNFAQLWNILEDLQDRMILPKATPESNPSWFGFPITCRGDLDRKRVVSYLESKGVATRPLFAGNLVRQPAYRDVKYIQISDLHNADVVMRQSFYVGVHPGLTEEHVEYLGKCIREAVTQ